MPTNDFLPFAVDVNAGVMSQADYAERAGLGVVPGIADPDFANKAWRQAANMAAALGEMIKAQGIDALDNGEIASLSSNIISALKSFLLPLSGGTLSNGTDSLLLMPGLIELSASQPFIDFHHANSTVDHTARIINDQDGRLVVSVQNDTNTQSKNLNLNIDGTLTWDDKDVATIQTGTWTPTLTGEVTTGALTYSTRTGVYVKLGRLVAIMGQIVVSAITTQPEGYCMLSGLPYVLSGSAVIPIRGLNGQNNCARKVIHAAQNSSGISGLRIQGVNPNSVASTGQIENLRWSTSDSGADYLMFGTSAPRMEIDICGCYLTTV